jgi:cold shock CspA family protein
VASFDDHVGLGTITLSPGDGVQVTIPFHCIAIADGTRTIRAGTAVSFTRVAKLGRYEAAHIQPA